LTNLTDARLSDPGNDTDGSGYGTEATDRFAIAVQGFLEAIPPGHPFEDWPAVARGVGSASVEYFYGAWREGYKEFPYSDPMDRETARRELMWIDVYRESLLAGLMTDDEMSLSRLLAWPDVDLPGDDGTWDLTPIDNQYHIWLAKRLRGESGKAVEALASEISGGKRARPRLLLGAAQAALGNDGGGFAKLLRQALANFRKSEFDPNQLLLSVHIEGSILWHVARRRGTPLPKMPDSLMDLLLRLP
jgi:hypothetical protein